MVHLGRVMTDKELAPSIEGLEKLQIEAPTGDDFHTSVYGSRFAAEDLPKHEMPEKEVCWLTFYCIRLTAKKTDARAQVDA